jgi:hypothetical protein
LVRSAIKTFASTAKPRDKMTAAAPESVSVTFAYYKIPSNITVYPTSATDAITPGTL